MRSALKVGGWVAGSWVIGLSILYYSIRRELKEVGIDLGQEHWWGR